MQGKAQKPEEQNEKVQKNDEDGAIIIYKYKRPFQADSIQQIGINNYPRKRIKPIEQHLAQQMEKKLKMQEKKQQQVFIPDFILQKVNIGEKSEKKQNNVLLEKIYNNTVKMRQRIRQSLFNEARGIKTQGVKIVDISQQHFVDFNGKKMRYQSFQPLAYDYYILKKNTHLKPIQKTINLPQETQFDDNEIKNQDSGESDDSNRQDRPDYDYPDESSQENSEKSNSQNNSDEQGLYEKSQQQMDDDQLYKRYLKRCKQYKDDDKDQVYQI